MSPQDRLLQRALDGSAAPGESAAAEHLAAGSLAALRILDHELKTLATPVRAQRDDLVARIIAELPAHAPERQVRVRPIDVAAALIAATAMMVGYGMLGAARNSVLADTIWLSWAIGLSVISGVLLLVVPSLLRNGEAHVVRRFAGRPIAIGPVDVLIYRTVGASLVIGGIWLSW